jgi:hypothetical protein
VALTRAEETEEKKEQNSKRKDKEVHAYLKHVLPPAPFTMHTATAAKYVTKPAIFIHDPVMVP